MRCVSTIRRMLCASTIRRMRCVSTIMTDFKNRCSAVETHCDGALPKDGYRADSCRLKGWDYSSFGCYFVTICTQDRRCCLGEVVNGVMRLSPVGVIITEEWQNTATLRENVTLDESAVMPNHFHGIICINDPAPPAVETSLQPNAKTHCHASLQSKAKTHCNASLHFKPSSFPSSPDAKRAACSSSRPSYGRDALHASGSWHPSDW